MRRIIQRVLQILLVFLIILLIVVPLVFTWRSWGTIFSDFALKHKDLFESLSYIVGTGAMILAGIWWFLFHSEETNKEKSGQSEEQSTVPEAPPTDEPFKQELDHYLAWLINQHSRTRLHGLLDLNKAGKTQPLSTIYTSLEVSHRSRLEPDEADMGNMRLQRGREVQKELDMADLLTLNERVAIIGGAGSGKTTYLDFVAIALAKALRGEELDTRLRPPQFSRGWVTGSDPQIGSSVFFFNV